MQLQIEAAGKILGLSVIFGPKSVENSSELNNSIELTTLLNNSGIGEVSLPELQRRGTLSDMSGGVCYKNQIESM